MAENSPRDFVLERELNEVHLLLDNISSDARIRLPLESDSIPGLPDKWLRAVCQIAWPPVGPATGIADQAALLVGVKDYLNTLVKPASGMTIAFTLMVTQKEGVAQSAAAGPSREMMASTAYPDLRIKADGFREAMWRMRLFLLGWLVLTCVASWYVAFGNAALEQRSSAWTAFGLAEQRIGVPESATGAAAAQRPGGRPRCAIAPGLLTQARPYPTDAERQACEPLRRASNAIAYANDEIAHWLIRPGSGSEGTSAYAATLAAILGKAILPVLYGILGAGAAVLRALSRRIAGNLLQPRDLSLSLQQLALGAVMGACIGLFVDPPTDAGGQGSTVLAPVGLSTAALSFIAGFGVDAVFQTLESVIARVFNVQPAAPASPAPAPTPTPTPAR